MPLPLMNHSALALFAQRTRIPTSARSIGFCVIWVCISSISSFLLVVLRAMQLGVRLLCAIVLLLLLAARIFDSAATYFSEGGTGFSN